MRHGIFGSVFGIGIGLAVIGGVTTPATAETLSGTASYRERIAMPPGTTFEAVLEDISRADVAAMVLGRATYLDAGNPPYRFDIGYDGAAIDQAARYAVRARLTGPDGRLLFTTDTVAPVLTHGAPDRVDLRLVQVATEGAAAEPASPIPVHGLNLPQSFTGTLPCADCDGIRHHLDLWPEQAFHLRREWLKGGETLTEDALGRWALDGRTGALRLHGGGDGAAFWEVTDPNTLRLLDRAGNRIDSDLPYDLAGAGTLAPTEIDLTMEGGFVYFADAAMFEVCVTGQRFPVAVERGYLEAERAYLDAGIDPQAPLMMVLDGRLAVRTPMEGPDRMHLVIDRLIATQPGRTCTQARAQAGLTDTYWKLTQLGAAHVAAVPDMREPHMVLRGGDQPGMAATMGCNRMMGGYEIGAGTIAFSPVASTMMACPDPVAGLERDFAAMLEAADGWQIAGQTLILRAGDAPLAVFEAVYLP